MTTNILQIVSLLELLLGQTIGTELSKNLVLHLRPSQTYAVTTVHVDVTEVELNLHVFLSLLSLNDAELDVTVANDVAFSVNQVDTYQRLAVDDLTSSGLTLNGVTILVN